MYMVRKPLIIVASLTLISLIVFFIFNLAYRDQILVNQAFFRMVNIPSPSLVDIVQKSSRRNLSKDDSAFLYRLSTILIRKRMRSEAIEVLGRALKNEPDNPQLKLQLATELFNDGRYEEVERLFNELLSQVR
ncbi:MAG: hypothetical protein A3G93_00320 [Nitrospinae bacterium RIFCSPLOWO2_12_FULL_45_22]|nr:MAG: hypothetical protein A3G93_00320 [Nitrospinae bacterium RIFCSPLOWO2_12_FULL_45_22]